MRVQNLQNSPLSIPTQTTAYYPWQLEACSTGLEAHALQYPNWSSRVKPSRISAHSRSYTTPPSNLP